MKTVIKIPSDAVLSGTEIISDKTIVELPAMLLNQETREQIQRTIDSGKFEITIYQDESI